MIDGWDDDDDEVTLGTALLSGRNPRDVAPRQPSVLFVIGGESTGYVFTVQGPSVLGRSHEVELPLKDDGISRRHARIAPRGGMLWIEDLGSTNGTLVNGHRIDGAIPLDDGDCVEIGNCALVHLHLRGRGFDDFERCLYRAAVHDPALNISRRLVLEGRLDEEMAYATRHGQMMALLLVELVVPEGLAPLGHLTLMRSLAVALRTLLRREDILARMDASELGVLCRSTTRADAADVARRVLTEIAAQPFEFETRTYDVRLAIGMACGPTDRVRDGSALMEAAHDALMDARNPDRGPVVIH